MSRTEDILHHPPPNDLPPARKVAPKKIGLSSFLAPPICQPTPLLLLEKKRKGKTMGKSLTKVLLLPTLLFRICAKDFW